LIAINIRAPGLRRGETEEAMGETRSAARRASLPLQTAFGGEFRDTEQAIQLWSRKSAEFGRPPPASAFDIPKIAEDSHRFFICADLLVREDSALILYGAAFAKLLGLPERPVINMPLLSQIPTRYRHLFAEGCDQAIQEAAPVRLCGAVTCGGDTELYRASFMPLRMHSATLQLVYGSFNCRLLADPTYRGRPIGGSERSAGATRQRARAGWRPQIVA
jgi:hypothetical protein